jgi:thiamine biosynthesis lipoprotein
MPCVNLALHAMATRFELVLHGENAASLRAAGEEVFEEIERLEARLSLYRSTSEIAHVNARAARTPVGVTPGLFALLEQARRLSEESGGAFDITVAPLVRCWGFMDGDGRVPDPEALVAARARIGMGLVRLDPAELTVSFAREGVMLDLGAIGKGYAIERAIGILREAGITSGLLHGGTSTVYALGRPPETEAWKIAIEIPPQDPDLPYARLDWKPGGETDSTDVAARASVLEPKPCSSAAPRVVSVRLRDEALSVSAVWGKFFRAGGKKFGHVLDPRTGQPVTRAVLAVVVLPSATETDALSTALLVEGVEGHRRIAQLRPGMRTLVAVEREGGFAIEAGGIEVEPPPGTK